LALNCITFTEEEELELVEASDLEDSNNKTFVGNQYLSPSISKSNTSLGVDGNVHIPSTKDETSSPSSLDSFHTCEMDAAPSCPVQ